MERPGDLRQAPCYWLTGNPRLTTGSDEYPMYGSVVSKLRPGPADLPTFAPLGEVDVHPPNSLARSFLGPAHAPLVFDPMKDKDAITRMLKPQLEVSEFDKNAERLKSTATCLRSLDTNDELSAGLDKYQQTAFNLLRSPKLRNALDLSKESAESIERVTRNKTAKARYATGDR